MSSGRIDILGCFKLLSKWVQSIVIGRLVLGWAQPHLAFGISVVQIKSPECDFFFFLGFIDHVLKLESCREMNLKKMLKYTVSAFSF